MPLLRLASCNQLIVRYIVRELRWKGVRDAKHRAVLKLIVQVGLC